MISQQTDVFNINPEYLFTSRFTEKNDVKQLKTATDNIPVIIAISCDNQIIIIFNQFVCIDRVIERNITYLKRINNVDHVHDFT